MPNAKANARARAKAKVNAKANSQSENVKLEVKDAKDHQSCLSCGDLSERELELELFKFTQHNIASAKQQLCRNPTTQVESWKVVFSIAIVEKFVLRLGNYYSAHVLIRT